MHFVGVGHNDWNKTKLILVSCLSTIADFLTELGVQRLVKFVALVLVVPLIPVIDTSRIICLPPP